MKENTALGTYKLKVARERLYAIEGIDLNGLNQMNIRSALRTFRLFQSFVKKHDT